MAYYVKRKRRKLDPRGWYRPWEWELFGSSHGLSYGDAWTKHGAEKQLLMEQGRWFGSDR